MKLRTQLTLAVTAVVVLVVALAGLLVMLRVDDLNGDQVDRALATRTDEISADATRSGALPADNAYAVRLIQNGKVRAEAGPAGTFPLPAGPGYATVTVDGHRWRSLTRVLVTGTELEVLRSLDDVEVSHTGTVLIVDLAVLVAALLAAAGSWYLAGLGLRPLSRLRDRIAGPGPHPPEVAGPPEVTELAAAVDGALDRLRVTPPVTARPAAEPDMRAPLANLGTDLEKLLSDPDLPATQRHLLLAAMADEHARLVTMLEERSS
jgi:signal transduction histidine kinase